MRRIAPGIRIVLTTAHEDGAELRDRIADLGWMVIFVPLGLRELREILRDS